MTDLRQRIELRGDTAAFRALYTGYGSCLKGYFMRQGANAALAEELTREAVLTGWHRASVLNDAGDQAPGLIFTIARNLMIGRIYKGFSWHDQVSPKAPRASRSTITEPADLKEILMKLPAPLLEILTMAYLEGLSNQAIAQRLDLGPDKVRAHLDKACELLCASTAPVKARAISNAERDALLKIHHHPDPATLIYYAAGSLPEGLSAVIATHCALCPKCHGDLGTLDALGALLVMTLPPKKLDHAVPALTLRALEAEVFSTDDRLDHADGDIGAKDLPGILAGFVGDSFDDLTWTRCGIGIRQRLLSLSGRAGGGLRLIKLAPGRQMPHQRRNANELTVVLGGCYHSDAGQFARGDVVELRAGDDKGLVADEFEGCIGLQAYGGDGEARLKPVAARWLWPFGRSAR